MAIALRSGEHGSRPAVERLGLAIVLSLAVHAIVVLGIRARTPDRPGGAPAPLTARIEALVPDPQAEPEAPPSVEPPPAATEARPESEAPPTQAPAPVDEKPLQRSEPAPPQAATEAPTPVLEVPVARDPTYYAARFLDEYPRPLTPIELKYPPRAAKENLGGKVTLLLLIDENGALSEISVVEANPASYFEESALQGFRGVRFSPAKKGGRAVKSRVVITVGYEPGQDTVLR